MLSSARRYVFFANWPWSVMAGITLAFLGVWVILVKRTLDSGLQTARALCSLPQVSSCNMAVSLGWRPVVLPLLPLLVFLATRWFVGSRREPPSGGRLTSA